jgi:hypothetical protein
MSRWFSALMLLAVMAVMLAPAVILVEFHLNRAKIERELCVQRDVVEAMRTCHGECQLSKRFKALEQEAEAGFPVERIQTRYEPQIPFANENASIVLVDADRAFPTLTHRLLQGVATSLEHVPRS